MKTAREMYQEAYRLYRCINRYLYPGNREALYATLDYMATVNEQAVIDAYKSFEMYFYGE